MRRTHISKSRSGIEVEPRAQSLEPTSKPKGLWYEVNADWRRWCRDEMPEWIADRHLHRIVLGDERMLELRGVAQMDRFVSEFHVSEFVSGRWFTGDMDRGIEWARVAERWDGIEIAPYIWRRRLDGPMWYYGWDCASGVIWQPRGVRLEWMRRLPATETISA